MLHTPRSPTSVRWGRRIPPRTARRGLHFPAFLARRRARTFVDAMRVSAAQKHLHIEDWGPEAVAAALKLQSFYRGTQARAQLIAEKGERAEQLIVRVHSRRRSQNLLASS